MRSFCSFAAAAFLALTACAVHAYQIVEAKYRVEISPGVFQDQLVVRCEDGRELTLPWDKQLREACGEGPTGAAAPVPAAPVAVHEPARQAPMSVHDFSSSPEVQKRMLLTQLRVQSGDVPEQMISFEQGPDGLTMRRAPALSAVLDQFETCRIARRTDCVALRNAAYERMRGSGSSSVATTALTRETTAPVTAASAKVQRAKAPRRAVPHVKHASVHPAHASENGTIQAQRAQYRAMMRNEIAEQFKWCVRTKPPAACDQARARALARLDASESARSGSQPAAPARVTGARQF